MSSSLYFNAHCSTNRRQLRRRLEHNPGPVPRFRSIVVLMAVGLLAVACGGGDSEVDTVQGFASSSIGSDAAGTGTEAASSTDRAEVSEPAADTSSEGSIADVAISTVRIDAEGTLTPLGEGTLAGAWGGTGFIINDEGYALTNNHVVTGSAVLRVSGEGVDETVNARVLGVSECSDLALIDLDGDGYVPLEFRSDPVTPGLPVFAAGYPGFSTLSPEDVDYTVTGGVVSTITGSGDTQLSSVESVVEHDARIRGGNSGGPLVDEQGRVVGINYFGNDVDDFNLAIAAAEAESILDELADGDVESIGVNGEATILDDGTTGVWVLGIDPGSVADQAGVEAGDVIVSLQGIPLAQDGTLANYCDVLRSHGPDDVIGIEIFRFSTQEFLEGQLNGEPLTPTFSFAQEVASQTESVVVDAGGAYSGFELVADDSNSVSVEVPVEWAGHDGAPNELFGPSVWATTDLAAFSESFDVPGLILEVNFGDIRADELDLVLDDWDFTGDCVNSGRFDFVTTDEFYSGRWEFWSECGASNSQVLTLAAVPADGRDFVVRMLLQAVSQRDLDALDVALDTFDAG